MTGKLLQRASNGNMTPQIIQNLGSDYILRLMYWEGVSLWIFLKALLKEDLELKPHSRAKANKVLLLCSLFRILVRKASVLLRLI